MEIKKLNNEELEITITRKRKITKEMLLRQKNSQETRLNEIKKQLDYFNEK